MVDPKPGRLFGYLFFFWKWNLSRRSVLFAAGSAPISGAYVSVAFNSPKTKSIIWTVEGKLQLNSATKLIFILIEEENGSRPSSLSTIAAVNHGLRPSLISFSTPVSVAGDFDFMGPSLFLYSLAVFTKQTSAHLAGCLPISSGLPAHRSSSQPLSSISPTCPSPSHHHAYALVTSVSSSAYPPPGPLSGCSFSVAPLFGFPGTVCTTVFSSPLCSFFNHCELVFLSSLKPASPWTLGTPKMVAFSVLCPLDPSCRHIPDRSFLSTWITTPSQLSLFPVAFTG